MKNPVVEFVLPRLLATAFLTALGSSAIAQDNTFLFNVRAEAADVRTDGQLDQAIRVFYECRFGTNRETLGDGDILVTGPGGYVQRGVFVSAEDIGPIFGAPEDPAGLIAPPQVTVATYRVFPSTEHDGPWSPSQNGAYAIQLRGREVSDKAGNVIPPSLIGSFRVALGNTGGGTAVLPRETRVTVLTDPVIQIFPPVEANGRTALVELFFDAPLVEVAWADLKREGNSFFASFEARTFPLPGDFAPPEGGTVFSRMFPLGELAPGDYRFVVRSMNQRLALVEFRVGETPGDTQPPGAVAEAPPVTQPGGDPQRITVTYDDPSGVALSTLGRDDLTATDPLRCLFAGEPNAEGDGICLENARLQVEFVEAKPVDAAGTRVQAVYAVLPPPNGWTAAANGSYQITLVSGSVCDNAGNCAPQRPIGTLLVAIAPEPPSPRAEIFVDAADRDHVRARVILTMPSDLAVVETSVTRGENGRIYLDAKAVPTPGAPGENLVAVTTELLYEIGALPEGAYVAIFRLNDAPLAERGFRVLGPPRPIPPHIAFVNIGEGNASHFAEVGVVLDRPGLGVLSWGEVRRDGSRFFVEIVVGPVDASIDPVEPAADLPEGWDPAIGGFPIRLVSHTYPLGVLDPGEYLFLVTSAGEPVARKPFLVGGQGPEATLSAGDIEAPKSDPHSFAIGFRDPSGLDHDSIRNAAVTVRGPDGFEAVAELTGYIPTLDPIGIGASATYAVRAPGGSWDAEDSGAYRVAIDASAVVDRDGNALARSELGGFQVRILPEPPQPPGRVAISTRLEDGSWFADVTVQDNDVRVTEWGELIRHGNSILALATAVAIDPDEIRPAVIDYPEHSYRIGQLAPGYYVFVFKTDLGHCGIARIRVPGLGDGGFDAWKDWIREGGGMDAAGNADVIGEFAQYAFALRPHRADAPEVHPEIFDGADGHRRGGLRFRRLLGATDVEYVVQCSRDMVNWEDAGDRAAIVERRMDIDGTEMVFVCLHEPIGANDCPFLRVVARRIK